MASCASLTLKHNNYRYLYTPLRYTHNVVFALVSQNPNINQVLRKLGLMQEHLRMSLKVDVIICLERSDFSQLVIQTL